MYKTKNISRATKFWREHRPKRDQRRNRLKAWISSTWNKFGVTMTLRRHNTFINLGSLDYSWKQKLQQKKIYKRHNYRGRVTQTLTYVSAGNCGLKGPKKSAPMANITIGELAATRFKKFGHTKLRGRFFGSGRRRKEIIKGFVKLGLVLHALKQATACPHNGTRHKKPRRK